MSYSSRTAFVYVKFRLHIFVSHLDRTYIVAYRSIRELQKKCHMTRVAGEPRQDYSFILVRHKMSRACRNGAQYLLRVPEHPTEKHHWCYYAYCGHHVYSPACLGGNTPWFDLEVYYFSSNEDARSVVNTPTGLLKYWVRTLGMVDTHPTAFDSCCLMAIVLIVLDDCCAPHQTRTWPLQPGDKNACVWVGVCQDCWFVCTGGWRLQVCVPIAVILCSGMFALTIDSNCSLSSPSPLQPQLKQHLQSKRLFFIWETLPFFRMGKVNNYKALIGG